MAQPFKFRYQNEIVGALVIGAVATILVVFVFTVRGKGWFEKHWRCAAVFSEADIGVLREGTPVRIRNHVVGRVGRSSIDKQGRLVVTLALLERFHDSVRDDVEGVLYTPMAGLPGDTFIELKGGRSHKRLAEGGTIKARAAADLIQLATDVHKTVPDSLATVNRLAGKVDRLLDQVDQSGVLQKGKAVEQLVERGDRLANKLEKLLDTAQHTLTVTNGTLAKVDHGDGLVAKVLNDRRLYGQVVASIDRMQGTMARVDSLLGKADKAGKDLPRMASLGAAALEDMVVVSRELRRLAPMMPSMVGRIDDVLFEGKALMDAAERHWLIGSYLEPKDTPGLLVPGGLRDDPSQQPAGEVRRILSPAEDARKPGGDRPQGEAPKAAQP